VRSWQRRSLYGEYAWHLVSAHAASDIASMRRNQSIKPTPKAFASRLAQRRCKFSVLPRRPAVAYLCLVKFRNKFTIR
jgi:hypothetical protein